MTDTAIGNAIIAAIGSEDTAVEQMSAVVSGLERSGFKIIPRPQYEALRAAAKALPDAERIIGDLRGTDHFQVYDAIVDALAALRAASLDLSEKG